MTDAKEPDAARDATAPDAARDATEPDASVPGGPAAPRDAGQRRVLPVVGAVVAVAALVAGGVWFQMSRDDGGPTTAVAPELEAAVVEHGVRLGTAAAPVIDVYVDYQCSHCAELEDRLGSDIVELAESGSAQVVLRPVTFLNRASARGAAALRCATEGGMALAMHQAMLGQIDGDFSPAGLAGRAAELGLAEDEFTSCLTSDETKAWVQEVSRFATDAGVGATPTVLVDDVRLTPVQVGSPAAFRDAVERIGS